MAEAGIVDCLEFAEGCAPRRWFLVRTEALLSWTELSWSRDRAEATRFPADVAERIVGEKRGDLPMLPTSPTKAPIFVRVVWGGAEEEAHRLAVEAAPAEIRQAPVPPPRPDIPARVAAARHQKQVMTSRRVVSECDALSRWEAEQES